MPSKDSSHKNSVCKSPFLCMRMDVSIRGERFCRSASLNCPPRCISPAFLSTLPKVFSGRVCTTSPSFGEHVFILILKCISHLPVPSALKGHCLRPDLQSSLLSSCSTSKVLIPVSFHSSIYSSIYSCLIIIALFKLNWA